MSFPYDPASDLKQVDKDVYKIGNSSSFRILFLKILVNGTSAVGIKKKLSLFLISNKSSLNLGSWPVPISEF